MKNTMDTYTKDAKKICTSIAGKDVRLILKVVVGGNISEKAIQYWTTDDREIVVVFSGPYVFSVESAKDLEEVYYTMVRYAHRSSVKELWDWCLRLKAQGSTWGYNLTNWGLSIVEVNNA